MALSPTTTSCGFKFYTMDILGIRSVLEIKNNKI
jgi:hypothetical protein